APEGRVQQHLAQRVSRIACRLAFCDMLLDTLMTAMFSGDQLPAESFAALEQSAEAAGIPAENIRELVTGNAATTMIGKLMTQADRAMRLAHRAYDMALTAWHREKERVVRRAMLDERRDRIEREAAAKAAKRATATASSATASSAPASSAPAVAEADADVLADLLADVPTRPALDDAARQAISRRERLFNGGEKRPLPVGDELVRAIRGVPPRS
ncbi:MAG: hypothetical protein AB7K09_17300, partial [Planctomycetota bacterium]